jgi:hypothetical protein
MQESRQREKTIRVEEVVVALCVCLCYKSVTRVLQECYNSVTRVLQGCYVSVIRVFHTS